MSSKDTSSREARAAARDVVSPPRQQARGRTAPSPRSPRPSGGGEADVFKPLSLGEGFGVRGLSTPPARWTSRIASAVVAIGYVALTQTGMLDDIRVWAQMRPPAIIELSQYGVPRGKTTTITVDGQNLIDADAVLFDDARITGKIVSRRDKGRIEIRRVEGSTAAPITDIANNTELIVEMTVPDDVEPGTHGFRVRTPLGTTVLRTFAI